MKTFISMLALAVCCLFFTKNSTAQGGFAVVNYMKVKPGMEAKYLECEKAWKTIHQKRKDQGKIVWWDLEECLYPSGANAEYDYLVVTFVKDWDAIGHLWDNWEAEQKAIPANLKEIVANTDKYRDIVKSEIWRERDYIGKEGVKPTIVVENFFKVPSGGWDDYVEMETKFVKPVHQKNIDLGNRAGWAFGIVVAPQGAGEPYDCSTVDLFEKWEDLDNERDGKAWGMVYPNMSDDYISYRIENTRTLVRREIRRVVMGTD